MSLWKNNWDETCQNHIDWWNHEGFVIPWVEGNRTVSAHAAVSSPGPPLTPEQLHADPVWSGRNNRHAMANTCTLGDTLPLVSTNIGPGSLALYLGSEPGFSFQTVWYHPCIADPESHPPLAFDPEAAWCRRQEAIVRENVRMAEGNYIVGCPDLIEHFDILASLRGNEELLMDLYTRPDWVKGRLDEINRAFYAAYDRIYDMIRLPDGSSAFGPFHIWGPGKTVKVQCDAAAMLSPDHFAEFVVPSLAEQCRWLDHSMFHLDGTDCIRHLDLLLAIPDLDAIEWTPQNVAGQPQGGDPHWYPLYRRILDAGKSIQAIRVTPPQAIDMLNELGTRGLYLMVRCNNESEYADLIEKTKAFRRR